MLHVHVVYGEPIRFEFDCAHVLKLSLSSSRRESVKYGGIEFESNYIFVSSMKN